MADVEKPENLDAVLKNLTPKQREVFLKRLAHAASPADTVDTASAPPDRIPAQPRVAGKSRLEFPLSSAQQRLWFLDRLAPGSPVYAIPAAIEVTGRLDAAALAASLSEIVRRHEALRTTFAAGPHGPVQVIDDAPLPSGFDLPLVDLRHLPAAGRQADAQSRATAEARRPFDLERGPLLRALLLRLEDERHLCVLTVHHIVSDGWSMGVMVREIAALYPAFAAGQPSPLPPPRLQYADYAVWEQERLHGEILERELSFWRERLAGAPAVLDLPADHPRPAHQSFNGAQALLRLEPELVTALRQTGSAVGATLFMTVLAGWDILLSRWTGQETVLVGSPIANRARAEVGGIIGFLGNMVVLRGDLAGDSTGAPSLGELLGRVRGASLAAFGHPEIPFARLVDELRPERDLGRSPLFQTVFILQPAEAEALELPGLRITPRDLDTGTAKFEVTLQLAEGAGGVSGWIEYNTDLFAAATVERMAEELLILLRAFPSSLETRISELPLLTPAEQAQLAAWNGTARVLDFDPASPALLHELIAAQAERTPEAPAVSCRGVSLTYRELMARSSRLARHLRRLGVGPEVRVGLCVERSIDMVVALLGIVQAGGAYVPLDPAHPAERLAMVLEDSGVAVLVTEEGLLPSQPRAFCPENQILYLDRDREAIAAEESSPLPRLATAESLAYVIYTSGSTGRPKGVQVSHGAIVSFLRAMAERTGIGAGDVVPAITTLSFDIAGLEIYLPLTVGGRVEVVGKEEAADGGLLAARLRESGATLAQATPATWRLLLGTGWEGIPGLRVLCGGEALPRDLADALLACGIELWNVYGPTETAVWSTAGKIEMDQPVLLGPPLANTELHVVDRGFFPVPAGAAGELLIGGRGVARGYLGRPELTAERFVPHPWSAEPGARLYRTGDLVRWRGLLDDRGELEFLGRLDHQVKVRGFRIELGEIEAALGRHPGVAQAVVLARGDDQDRRLVGYLVPALGFSPPLPVGGRGWERGPGGEGLGADLDTSEIQAHLRRTLPEYMVPAAFVILDAFPLNPSGKVDRRALPDPASAGAAEKAPREAPRTALERELARLWSEILAGVAEDSISIHDNFFQLGGNSISGAVFINRLQGRLGEVVGVATLFDAPTVARLAAHLGAELPQAVERLGAERAGGDSGAVWSSIPRRELDGEPLPLSFAQERLLVLHQLDPHSAVYNLNGSVRLQGTLDVPMLERCLTELVRRHEALRTTFDPQGEQPLQIVLPPFPVRLPLVDLSALPVDARREETQLRAAEEDSRPFDVLHGALFRATLLRLEAGEHALLLTFHHICSDGWSIGIVVRELVALYRAFLAGEPSPLPELPIQYGDFALWQRRTLQGEALEEELGWWRRHLAGPLPEPLLPVDRRRSSVQGFQAMGVGREIPPALARAVEELARQTATSPFMIFLAVWKGLLARLTGEEDVVVGTSTANRTRPEVEGLIGVFLNNLMLRTGLAGDPPFRDALLRVRETVLGAFAHQSMPLQSILPAAPPLKIMFLMMNLPAHTVTVPGLTFSALEAERDIEEMDTALLEVGLNIEETADGLQSSMTYNGFLFDRVTVERFLERWHRLLAGVAADPGKPLWSYDLLSAAERSELLAGRTVSLPAPAPPVHRTFEERAAASPEALAVIGAGRTLTYGELDRWADRTAHHLRGLGVGPETVVGVALERSPELIVALLAVLKAGGAYVPLDPAWPEERLAYILEDAGAAVLLTSEAVLEAHPTLGAAPRQTVLLDEMPERTAERAEIRPEIEPGNLAYLIYTSGSTGRPKGVMVRHGSLAAYVAGFRAEHGLGPADRVLQLASIGFDTSAEEIYPCLTSGAALVLRDDTLLGAASDFLRACGGLGITILDLPTAFWHEMVARLSDQLSGDDPAPTSMPASLRLAILGGERVLPERLAAWHALRGLGTDRVRLVNTYGPTEATIVATRCALPPGQAIAGEVPIGRPVPGARAFVADPNLELAAPGIAGELCIGGTGVARGYLGRPDLTAERFVPDPWSREPGARVYRTGDLVRLLPTGDLEFLGRTDDQVKIRGFRVELREIEAALGRHAGIADAVVTAREDVPGDRRLAAYVVARQDAAQTPPPTTAALRAFLQESLPDYMVPAAFVFLDSLPLTPSGKVDRRGLPAPDGHRPGDGADYVEPETDVEKTVAAVWAKVLGVDRIDRISATDNFFHLGGHSLLLPQVLHQLRTAFQVEIPLRVLFDEPTLDGLALTIEEILLEDIERQLGEPEGEEILAR
jgi:amino acid adenylation domain-containing protein